MALIPGYEYDIFISYVHADNESETFGEDGWIDQFYKYLDTKLNKHSKDIKIWWDSKNLDRSEVFDNSIAEAIDKSAIMICLYSRLYPQSDYCLKELDHFYTKANKEEVGLIVGNRSRIIPVFMSNIPHSNWLDKLSGTSGFPFHDNNDYGDPLKNTSPEFSAQMIQLRNALVKIFEDFPKEITQVKKPIPITQEKDKGFTIYLSEVNDSMFDRREGIIADLKGKGYNITVADTSFTDVETHEKATTHAIENSQLAVHILGDFPGRKIPGESVARFIQSQAEIGLKLKTPQLIWVSRDIDFNNLENEQHREFLKGLKDGTLSTKKYEFVRGNEGELAMLIDEYAKQLQERLSQKMEENKATNGTAIKVLLDTHTDDFKQAFNLKKILNEYNVDLIFNPEDGDPQENIKSLYSNISEAKKFIFLYGNETHKDWVDIRVKNTLKKLMDYDRYGQDIFIYVTPPEKSTDAIKVAQNPMVKLVDQSHSSHLDGASLEAFLNDLKSENQ
ncbi:toll/interleukin-1 receptor domain-containing protein [Aequorivita sp. SDUM287046]|uniref:Toll/interleukin-1 receptor domain-containing protein n=1 Tax=Aequorivita aurantiaca TaxID=3053356 RepID=A0ABT8DG01_9FLAO|nr:toll/interleukin-1 receptor domain-containing protein [Aequorivita aurantiaca]MDN3723569.1 toll/interleukin-1 receptor domain-containing protein [Aequorivita aurantiaca]